MGFPSLVSPAFQRSILAISVVLLAVAFIGGDVLRTNQSGASYIEDVGKDADAVSLNLVQSRAAAVRASAGVTDSDAEDGAALLQSGDIKKKDARWLASKAQEKGVIKLPSGLMYKVLERGPEGGSSPGPSTQCDVTYAGQLTNGKEFDAGTTSFAPNEVIKGWTEAMQMMKEGDKWELYIPSDLAYGDRGASVIPPGAALVFQMKINKVLGASASPSLLQTGGIKKKDAHWLAAKAQEKGVTKLPSGLMYKVLERGPEGGASPGPSTQCDVTYAGQLISGKEFDAGTTHFAPNEVIKGWTEAMQMMKEGDKWELYIPSDLAYGDRGASVIPPGAALVFQMKINKVLG